MTHVGSIYNFENMDRRKNAFPTNQIVMTMYKIHNVNSTQKKIVSV